jgi:hypothetical protein
MSDSVSFDPDCAVVVTPDSVTAMIECYCLAAGTTLKDFDLGETPVKVDAVSGTLSFYGLNWPWWKRLLRWFGFLGGQSTAICGTIGSSINPLIAFDIQGKGGEPQIIPVSAVFPGGIPLDKLHFDLNPDLALPTDFRTALVFHRC